MTGEPTNRSFEVNALNTLGETYDRALDFSQRSRFDKTFDRMGDSRHVAVRAAAIATVVAYAYGSEAIDEIKNNLFNRE